MSERTVTIDGVPVPRFLYGTAWKEDDTTRLTELAITQGFRGIDTANQRKHYHEAGVGKAIQAAIANGSVKRENLFLQTKFTFAHGQDHRLPYDPKAPIATQVEQSFAKSLEHLGVSFINSYVLHGPMFTQGLKREDWDAWKAMEAIHDSGRVQFLGISNVTREQLEELFGGVRVKPSFVQNRCYASRAWDRRVREFCTTAGIHYQGFSLLTANRDVVLHPELMRLSKQLGKSTPQIIFRFAIELGMLPLTGTKNEYHMRMDLEACEFSLERKEVELIERLMVNVPTSFLTSLDYPKKL